jgi:hypothetical protein
LLKVNRNKHKSIHSREKKFLCHFQGCAHTTSRKGDMNRHKKLHTPETPYLCNVRGCWEKFADMNERDEHKKKHGFKAPREIQLRLSEHGIKAPWKIQKQVNDEYCKIPQYREEGEEDDELDFLFKDQERRIGIAPSKIHGMGVFAKDDILQDVVIAQYVGERVKSRFLNDREIKYLSRGIKSTYLFRINKTEAIDATEPKYDKRKAKFINHHCEPNIKSIMVEIERSKIIIIYTLRKVARGRLMLLILQTKDMLNLFR